MFDDLANLVRKPRFLFSAANKMFINPTAVFLPKGGGCARYILVTLTKIAAWDGNHFTSRGTKIFKNQMLSLFV